MSGVRGIFVLSGLCALALGPIALASHDFPQANAQAPSTLTSETRAVQIEVNVLDSHGDPVTDLSKSDFTIFDAGKPREIQIFSVAKPTSPGTQIASTEAPLLPPSQKLPPNIFTNISTGHAGPSTHSTVVLIDSYDTSWDDIVMARPKVESFLTKLPLAERVAIYDYSTIGVEMVQDFTTDHELAAKTLDHFTMPPMKPAPPAGGVPVSPVMSPGPTEALQVAQVTQLSATSVFQTLSKHLALVPGRKSILWLTGGFPERQIERYRNQWDRVMATTNDADIAIDAIDAHICVPPENCSLLSSSVQSEQAMRTIADWTGGREFDHRSDIDTAMLEALGSSEPTYVLGFYLSASERDGKYHPLKVEVNRRGVELHYRQGYYAGAAPEVASEQKHGDLEESLLNPTDESAVGVTAEVTAASGKPNGTLRLRLNLAPQTIGLKQSANGWSGKIDELFVETDDTGATLGKLSTTKAFQVARAAREQFDREGATLPETLPIATGASKLRIVVRDKITGHVGTLTITLADLDRGGE